jgi:hypothetical protein
VQRVGRAARERRAWQAVAAAVALALVALLIWMGARSPDGPPPRSGQQCTVEAGGTVRLDAEQMANAATITAVGSRLEMPERAVVVALATALQESKLRNLPHLGDHNDHDSVGLFQQRPSQGWGSEDQLRDPRYAAERFFRALQQVPAWDRMRVTEAAQLVQRSAFPEAYQKWEHDATVLATALLGRAGGAVACTVADRPAARGAEATAAVRQHLSLDWGEVTAVPAGPDGDGLSVVAQDRATGWRYAHWLVSHAGGLGVARVHFGELEWSIASPSWRAAGSASTHVFAEVVPDA